MSAIPTGLVRDLAWEAELGRVLRALEAGGIPVLLLKGAAYRGREYARGERCFQDADLLVRPRDSRKARLLLRELGYAVHVRGEAHAVRPPFELDLHTRLYPDGDGGLWERSLPVEVGGGPARVLAPPDAFVYALWHGAVRHAALDGRLRVDLERISAGGGAGFWEDVDAELGRRGMRAAAAVALPRLGFPPRQGSRAGSGGWIYRWGLDRGPRGGTGHLLMAVSSRDPWRAAGRLARSAGRFLHGKCFPRDYNPSRDEAA